MAQAVQLPDGRYFPIKEGERPEDAYRAAMQLYPDAFEIKQPEPPKPEAEGGFFPALKAGYSALKSDIAGLAGRSGLMDLAEAEKYIAGEKKYQADTFKPTTEGFADAPLTNIKELLGGSLPYMAAPVVAGGAAALAAPASAVAGIGAAGLASLAQFTGSNLSRQVEAGGKTLGETDLADAALAAIPQAALDTISLRMIPGLGKVLEGAGIKLGEQEIKNFAGEAIKKTAVDYAVKTGKTMGIEGLTEAGQQVFERAQAGLSISDPEARQEYFDSFIGGAVLGGVIAPAGRYIERGQAQTRYDIGEAVKQQTAQQEQLKLDALAAAEEEQRKSSPEYFQTLSAEYKAAEQAKNDLIAQKRKIVTGSDTETADRLHNTELSAQLKEMMPKLTELGSEYNRLLKVQPKAEEITETPAIKPNLAVGDTLDNPLGNFTKEELASRAPTVAKYIDTQRKKAGKPALETYSIEDIRNAMPNQLPEAEQADLSSLIAAKTGHTGDITYKPTDVLEVAKQKNIDTTTDGFKDFLRRATGDAEIEQLTQPQLHSAFTALSSLPRFDEPQILPTKRNATDYSKEQYDKAVTALQKLVEKRGKEVVKEGEKPIAQPVSIEEANQVIKSKTGLKNDADVQTLFRDANRNGDIDFKGNEVTYRKKGAQAEFNIEEGFAPAEGTGFNVMRNGEMLFTTNDEAEAKAKAEKLGKNATPAIQQIDKSIAKENSTVAESQKALDAMEAEGKFKTPQYTQAAARHAGVVDKANKTIESLNAKKQMLQKPVTVQAAGKPTNRKTFTVKEKGVEEKAFNTREEAEKHALENLPEERLNELSTQTKAPGFANRLKKEQERRQKPVLALPAPKPPAPKGPSPEAQALEQKLLPMLRRFGLGNVALKIQEAMKDEGSYGASVITVALDAANPIRVLRHETIHGLKDLGFFTPGQWEVLRNKANNEWIDKYLKQRNVDGGPIQAGEQSRFDAYVDLYDSDIEAIKEEAIADAFADFDVNGAPKGLFSTLLEAMRKFFRALRSALNGAGYDTAEDIFGKVERGELQATKAAEDTEETKKSLVRKAVKDESEISTQNPQAKNRLYDPLTDMLSIDEAAVRESMAQNPELEKNMIETIKSYGFIPANTKDEDVIKVFKDNIVNNLLHLYNRVPEDVRQRSKLWYDGANRIAIELGARYDMSKEQVSGILAAMSPQKDWFQNVSMAERAIEILTNNGDATWTPQMMDYARSYINEAEDRKDREKRQIFFDKRITEMNRRQVKLKDMSVKDAAAFVRAYDEAFHDRKYRIVTPEGGFGGLVMNKNVDKETGVAKPATMMWSTYSPIEKTVSIFRNPSRENISQQLGEEHKIRSFYNNIVAPNSPIGHVTIDTHAVAAGLYEALAGSDPEVLDNFGGAGRNTKLGVGGTYGLIADAYREAAKQVGLKPREMQSITWEAVRGMFPENIKSQIKKPIRAEWTKFRTGEQSFDETRRNIEALGERADRPDWFTSGEGEFVDDGGSSFDISFTPEGGVRLRKEKELVDKAIVNLSAVTKSIPGLDLLHTRALNGDVEAYAVLQNVAASTLKHLLSGTNARVTVSGVKGVYESDREPAIVAQVRFKESDTTAVLAALAKFADNFNQEQIHVRTKTAYKVGHDFGDGTYATPVYTVKLKNELTEQDIVDIVNNAGLKGFSVSQTELTAYHVQGEENDTAGYKEFLSKLEGIYESYGADDGRLQFQTQRLAVYGRGYGARLGYADISGIVRPKQDSDKATPRIIGEYLTRHPVKAFEQKALTKAQTQEQTVLKDVFQVLPKNDLKKPLVRKAYEALAKEVKRQYEALPIKVVLTDAQFDENGKYVDIYKNSAEMRKDVSLNNTFKVLKTDANTFGPEGVDFTGHPLLGDSGVKDINNKTMLYNDLLRAVHDYFAHNLSDTEFGPKGEFAAWKNHMATTTDPLARWALTNETRAQNAWQNFRPEVKNVALKERGFADQKASLPPVAFTLTGDEAVDAPMLQYIGTLNAKQKLGSLSEKSPLVNKLPSLPEAPTTRASLRTAPQTAEFKQWFGDSKIVNAIDKSPVSGEMIMEYMGIPENEQDDYWRGLTSQERDKITKDYRKRNGEGTPKVMYHGTARDITTFKPKQAGAIFVTDNPQFAGIFAGDSLEWMSAHADQFLTETQLKKGRAQAIVAIRKDYGKRPQGIEMIDSLKSGDYIDATPEAREYLRKFYKDMMPSGPNILPVYVRSEKPFDFDNREHVQAVLDEIRANDEQAADYAYGKTAGPRRRFDYSSIADGRWEDIESAKVQAAIKSLGFDGFYVLEGREKNLAVYDSSQLKSATGNEGTYDINNPDIRKSLRTAPDTPEFKRWFKKSKVVDEDGKPLVVYHTGVFDSNEIISGAELNRRTGKDKVFNSGNEGIYFTADPKYSALYGRDREGTTMYPVYLSLQKPFVVESKQELSRLAKLKNFILGKREVARTRSEGINPAMDSMWVNPEYKAELIKQGYDGIINKVYNEIVVFEPTQIKSAIGNQGTYDPTNPDIRKSLRTNVKNDISSMPNGAAILATMNRVTPPREQKGFVERITRALAPEAFSYFRQQALDRYNRLSDYDKLIAKQMGGIDLLADQSAHWAALHSDNAAGVTASALGIGDRMGGVPVLKNGYFTVSNLNGTVKGLVEIIAPLARHGDPDIYRSYQLWSAAKRGTRLNREGRFELMTPQEIKDALTLEQKYPEFVDVQKEWIKYNNGLVKMQVDAGIITKEAGQEFMKYSDYLPLYRQMDGEKTLGPSIYQSISGVKAPKTLTGKGTGPIEDYLETIVRNTQAAVQASMKNVAAKKAVENGMILGMVKKLPAASSAPNTITILENGKKVSYECADKLWVEAVSSLNLPELPFLSILAKPADLLRSLVTKDPGFMLANMMRDSVSAYVTSGANINPVVSTVKNYGAAMMNRSPIYQALLNSGALGGYEFSRDVEAGADALAKDLRKKTGTQSGAEKLFKPFTGVWNFLERGTEASDAATRMAVYEATLKETGNEAEAIRRAVEVMNFNRKGRSAVVRIAAAAIPFLNARVQGLDVFFRAGIRPFYDQNATAYEKQVQKAMLIRGATIMALSTMYAATIMGDPDYEKQEQETKDNFWLIPSLGIKLPIPFEVGVLFKTVPERIYRYYYGADTSKDLADSMKRALQSTFAFNPVPQAVAPLMEARDNYSVFTQRPIVGEAMRNIAPEYQVGPSTTKFAEYLGKQTGMSPIMIDHVYKGYTGTMGMYLADVMDSVYSAGSDNPKASQRFEQTPVLKRFLLDPEARGQVSAYYDLKHSVDQTVRTVNLLAKQGSPELEGYLKENISMLGVKNYVASVDKQMQKLSAQAAMVRSTPMPADEKRKMLDEITKIQNQLTNEVQLMKKIARP